MIDAIPLFLLWLVGQRGASKAAKARKGKGAPPWPTPSSPPPIPAFQPRAAPPSADPGGTSTPLASLHESPPTPRPASAIDTAKQAAQAAIRKRTTALIQKQAAAFNPFAKSSPTSTALVSNLQKILTTHGVKVAPDGLYGPKTASAWTALAKRKGLPPSISREGPKIAKVVTQTFERLSVPPIP